MLNISFLPIILLNNFFCKLFSYITSFLKLNFVKKEFQAQLDLTKLEFQAVLHLCGVTNWWYFLNNLLHVALKKNIDKKLKFRRE